MSGGAGEAAKATSHGFVKPWTLFPRPPWVAEDASLAREYPQVVVLPVWRLSSCVHAR